jgi:hypothetical protein
MPNTQRGSGAGGDQGLSATQFAEVGLQFAVTIIAFAAAGLWLDRRLGSSPWLLIVCVFAGAGGGFAAIYRRVAAAQRRDAERRAAHRARDAAPPTDTPPTSANERGRNLDGRNANDGDD